jgi:hypothetical protein
VNSDNIRKIDRHARAKFRTEGKTAVPIAAALPAMATDPAGTLSWELDRYVRSVAAVLGVPAHACWCDVSARAEAYLALTERLPGYPARDLALLWDEENGWAVAVETRSSEDMYVLAYDGSALLPVPEQVRGFLSAELAKTRVSRPAPPRFRACGDPEELLDRLHAVRRRA